MRYLIKIALLALTIGIGNNAVAGEVSRALFTIGVDDREPVIMVTSISADSYDSISFFTELTELNGHTVTHQWKYNDKVMFEKSFEVGGARWRVWTSKTLIPGWTGTWTVNVLDDDRSTLESKSFDYN